MSNLVFVYGTLRSAFDIPAALRLRESAELIGSATATGSIYRVAHYPGYRPEPAPAASGIVRGELYRMFDPPSLLALLDAYEDAEYARVLISVDCNGATHEAWIYRYDAPLPPDSIIPSGDFCA